jgi:pimeloyl-ACP methyl ester carboxylesterase
MNTSTSPSGTPAGSAERAGPPLASRICWAGLAGREHGADGAAHAPVVLLHGLTFDRHMWDPVLSALPQDRRAIAFDLPGHGGSPGLTAPGLTAVVEAVHRAVVDADLDAPIMVGHSIGGPLASIYAANYPAAAVVSVEAPIRLEPFAELLRSIRPQLKGEAFAAAWGVLRDSWQMELLPVRLRELLRVGDHASPEVVLSYQADLLERPLDEVVRCRDQDLDRLRLARTPYLSLHSRPVDQAERAWLTERLPQAEIVVWPVRHHFPHLAAPADFAALVERVAAKASPQQRPEADPTTNQEQGNLRSHADRAA